MKCIKESIQDFVSSFLYQIKDKYDLIKRIIKWIPVLNKTRIYDYVDTLTIMKFQLGELYQYYHKHRSVDEIKYENHCQKIMTAINLIDIIISNTYTKEVKKQYVKRYGKRSLYYDDVNDEFKIIWGSNSLKFSETINYVYKRDLDNALEKTFKAEKLLWKFIDHNIYDWWD